MRFRTHNNLYTLMDAGDGAFFISGHETYCPKPTLVTLRLPVIVGQCVIWDYAQPNHPSGDSVVKTTAVQEILP